MLYQRDVVPFCDAKFCKNTVYNNAFFCKIDSVRFGKIQ